MAQPLEWLVDESPTASSGVQTGATQNRAAGTNWLTVVLVCVLAFFVVRELREREIIPTPDDDSIVIDVDGNYALVLVDDSAQDDLSDGQKAVIGWSGMVSLAKEIGMVLRKYDVKADMSGVEPVFQSMKSKADDPPSLTIVRDKKLTTEPVPDAVEKFRQRLREGR